ncbi:DUF2271 domain-containing protein [Sphingomonas sp. ID0503]|uniref:DUF2271 domain-containing protein n=1 Tax=Sphingomonas sp. ID0503 TaxID=3399691 RepID=UPI003AFAA483
MRITYSLALTGVAATPAAAAGIDLTVEIPRLSVAEYHKPYVAAWIEQGGVAKQTVAVWYDSDMEGGKGKKWLADLRTWWRKAGRTMTMPADGVTGATRAPGPQKLSLLAGKAPLGTLAPGQYDLVIEAAREVGGRESLRLPFTWPAKGKAQTVTAKGTAELGAVTATIKP